MLTHTTTYIGQFMCNRRINHYNEVMKNKFSSFMLHMFEHYPCVLLAVHAYIKVSSTKLN